MHLAPKHLCICFNSSILRLSDWIFSSSSSVGVIVACSTDWINLQWIDAPSNIYTSEFYPEVLKFSRLVIHVLWLSCDDQPCSCFRRLNIDTECLYQDNFPLFWWFWWMKPRMRWSDSLPFKAALPYLRVVTCWPRPAWPCFNFTKIIRVSNSFVCIYDYILGPSSGLMSEIFFNDAIPLRMQVTY